jgi:hypothetical protein
MLLERYLLEFPKMFQRILYNEILFFATGDSFAFLPTAKIKVRLFPVAVPDKIFGLTRSLDFVDRCHSLKSLYPPPAALPSLPLASATRPLSAPTMVGASSELFPVFIFTKSVNKKAGALPAFLLHQFHQITM